LGMLSAVSLVDKLTHTTRCCAWGCPSALPPCHQRLSKLNDSLEHRRSVVTVVRMVRVIGSILELFI
jgi:hypothetical protein